MRGTSAIHQTNHPQNALKLSLQQCLSYGFAQLLVQVPELGMTWV